MEENKFPMGLNFLTLSNKYLHLVKNVIDETIKQGNPHMLFGDEEITPNKYEERTKWSDFIISIPILFVFYHGLELLLKGFLLLSNNDTLKSEHYTEKLLEEFKKDYNEEEKIIQIVEKYLSFNSMPDFLANCLKNNNISTNGIYNFLRYPADKNFQIEYNYLDLKYKEEKGQEFFGGLSNDLDSLLKESVKLYRKLEQIRVN